MTHRIAVLCGGMSLEREVSLRSGTRVAAALRDLGHDVTRLDVDAAVVNTLDAGGFDLAFLTLHGASGEDGTVQSVLDLIGLPYTGPDAISSTLAWNKSVAKGLYGRAGVALATSVTLSQQAFRELGASAVLDRVASELGLPLVVKPATGGSSLGLSVVERAEDLPRAIVGAFSYGDQVLVEQFVAGTEIAVSLLDGEALPAVEIRPKQGAYDYTARYTAGATEFHAPARLDPDVAAAAATAARMAWDAVGARHVSRADMIVRPDGTPVLLELDTCPGLTDTSLLPLAAQAAGLSFGDLCQRVVDLALASES